MNATITRLDSIAPASKKATGCQTILSIFMLLILGFVWLIPAHANNIQITNAAFVSPDAVTFDLDWENAWRTSDLNGDGVSNWDAAWVFVKYREPTSAGGDGLWKHAWLNTDKTSHSTGTGTAASIDVGTTNIAGTDRGMGVFIYRSTDGAGSFSIDNVRLDWSSSDQGVTNPASLQVRVFAIEMVYVAEGSFFVGSGGEETGSFTDGAWISGSTIPFQITSENALEIGNEAGKLWGTSTSGDSTIGNSGTLPAAYPKGFGAFYSMKYSLTQQQYVDFLNTLTPTQAETRDFTGSLRRLRISLTNGVYSTSNPFVAYNFVSWMDGAAYSDWAGLRPMTELEYEKAARGPATPVPNEYAWGTATIADQSYTLSNVNAATEAIATNYNTTGTAGNAWYQSTRAGGPDFFAPLRVGVFAANPANTGRVTAGASYWGIMELSGNLRERPVTVGNDDGRAFTGLNGDGLLSTTGHANVSAWPGLVSGEVTGATGGGARGGSWDDSNTSLYVSRRSIAATDLSSRLEPFGFRSVRSAPAAGGDE